MSRPRLLDLFCGAGGAAEGYHRAGFDVVGVDVAPQKHYPFEFHQADALEYCAQHGHEFNAIHASPPCQGYSALRHMPTAKEHPMLIDETRAALIATGRPWIIENVEGAPLQNPIILCGTMFGLGTGNAELWRHRLFELSGFQILLTPPHQHRSASRVIGVYGGHGPDRRRVISVAGHGCGHSGKHNKNGSVQDFTVKQRAEAMGIDWMTESELSQAIPPEYTKFIGDKLLAQLQG